MSKSLDALPLKQRHFVVEYLANGFNATEAAKAAGYSARTADSQGCRLLKNVKVAAALAEKTEKRLAKREITADFVLQGLARIAAFDPRKMFRADGSVVPVHEFGDDEAMGLAGFETKELTADGCVIGELKKIKLADRRAAFVDLGRHLKLFTDKTEHKHTIERVLVRETAKKHRPLPPSEPEFEK